MARSVCQIQSSRTLQRPVDGPPISLLTCYKFVHLVGPMVNQDQPKLPAASGTTEPDGFLQKIEAVTPKSWRSRLAKAATQLIAGTRQGANAYGEIRERLDTIEGRSIVNKALAEAVAKQAANDPEMVERAKARFVSSALQKQENLEAVIAGASEHLPLLPAPETVDVPLILGKISKKQLSLTMRHESL